MQRTAATLGATVIAALLSTGITVAETLSEDAIKYRHAVMDAMKGHISALSLMAFGKVNDPGFIDRHAVALASLGEELEHVFPAGSGDGETHALPIIWEEPERFAEALQAAKAATATGRKSPKRSMRPAMRARAATNVTEKNTKIDRDQRARRGGRLSGRGLHRRPGNDDPAWRVSRARWWLYQLPHG